MGADASSGSRQRGADAWVAVTVALAIATGIWASVVLARGRFALGGALLLASVVALRWPRSVWVLDACTTWSPPRRTLAVLAVTALAVFFRVYRLEPPGLWGDEAVNGLRAFDILDGTVTSPFELVAQPLTYFHALSNYPIAAAFELFGAGPVTLRLPGIVAGILCVPLLFGIAAPLFGDAVALVATIFFASSPWQVIHAKGLTQIVFGEFFLLAGVCALVRGVVGHRGWLIAAAGAPFALCLYTYHAMKLAPAVAVVFLAAAWWRRLAPRRALAGWSAAFLTVLVVCAIPAARSYTASPGALTERIGGVALWPLLRQAGSLAPLWDAVWRTLMIFQYQQGPVYNWFGIGSDPALTVIVAWLFVHGLVESLRRWGEPRHFLLLGWAAVGLIPGLLSTEAPRAYRIFLASPVFFVWAAMPVAHLYAAAARYRLVRTGVLALVASVPLFDFNYYFYRVYTHPDFRWFQAARMVDMARALKARGPGWTGYLMAEGFAAQYETLAFLTRAWGLTLHDLRSLADVLPLPHNIPGGALLLVERSNLPVVPILQAFYPDVEAELLSEPAVRTAWWDAWTGAAPAAGDTQPTVAVLAVSRQAADAAPARAFLAAHAVVAEYNVDGRTGHSSEPYPYYGFFVPQFEERFRLQWTMTVQVPEPGGYRIEVAGNGRPTLTVDDQAYRPGGVLSAGPHLVRIALGPLTEAARLRVYWLRPDGRRELIPPAALSAPDA